MANINFNELEAFNNKAKELQSYGYTFPWTLSEGNYNDVDYDTNGNLFTQIKIYKVILALDINENTYVPVMKYYKLEDAEVAQHDLVENSVYTIEQVIISEDVQKIYEAGIDTLLLKEQNLKATSVLDFKLIENNLGNQFEFKIENAMANSDSAEAERFDDVINYDWVLIEYSDMGREIKTLNDLTFRITPDGKSVILEADTNVLYKLIVHQLFNINDSYESGIEHCTIIHTA